MLCQIGLGHQFKISLFFLQESRPQKISIVTQVQPKMLATVRIIFLNCLKSKNEAIHTIYYFLWPGQKPILLILWDKKYFLNRISNFLLGECSCQQLRPVLIVLELAPLKPRNNRKDDNSTREIWKLRNLSRPPPPTYWQGVRQLENGASAKRRNFRPPLPPCG